MGTLSRATRRNLVQRGHPQASLSLQCRLLGLCRSTLYYRPQAPDPDELALMRRLMRTMGLEAIYCKPRCSQPQPGQRVYPYLLRNRSIERPHQVWCADITYIPLRRGYLYLVAVMDWASRCVLAWELSNTLDSEFCELAVEEALEAHPAPQMFNTDQGSQFTAQAFTGCLEGAGVRISMDGRGRWMDNVFIERLWRSLKYEAVYLQELADGFAARELVGEWIGFYNAVRPHSSLGGQTPWETLQQGGGT